MPYYFRPLQDQLDYLDHLINEVSSALADRPPGHIIVQHNHGCPQYYYKQNRSDRHGVYIRNANRSFIASVLQKEYETEFIKFAQKQRITLCRFQEQNTVRSASLLYHALATPYEKLSPDRKNLIKPYVLSDDAFIDSWLQVTYERKAFYSGEPVILTGNGTRVRSKSEKIIADTLDRLQIPYLYECPLRLTSGILLHPDFTLLDIRERTTVILEHFGLMTDQSYCLNSMDKRDQYLKAGFVPGYDLLCTMEGGRHTLDTRSLEALLTARFS